MIKFWLFVSNKGSSASFDPVFMKTLEVALDSIHAIHDTSLLSLPLDNFVFSARAHQNKTKLSDPRMTGPGMVIDAGYDLGWEVEDIGLQVGAVATAGFEAVKGAVWFGRPGGDKTVDVPCEPDENEQQLVFADFVATASVAVTIEVVGIQITMSGDNRLGFTASSPVSPGGVELGDEEEPACGSQERQDAQQIVRDVNQAIKDLRDLAIGDGGGWIPFPLFPLPLPLPIFNPFQ